MTLLATLALVVSFLLAAGMVTVLVLLRRGDGPVYRASRAYDENRREAFRVLTGEIVERVPADQRFDPARRRAPRPDDPRRETYRTAAREALEAVVPERSGLAFRADGWARLEAEDAWVVAELSTADLRTLDLAARDDRGRLTIGLVLWNPEPPGGPATRVALPVQSLFPTLRQRGRGELVERIERLSEVERREE